MLPPDSGQFMLAGMRVREFLFGREVELRSPLSPDELRSRINGAAGWMFWPFQSDRIVGGITFGWMRLRYMSGPFEYNAKPVLSGRVQADLSGSHIRARFGASVSTRFFFVLWYVFLATMFIAIWALPAAKGVQPFPWPIAMVFFVLPAAMHLFFTRDASRDLRCILAFLEEYAEVRAA